MKRTGPSRARRLARLLLQAGAPSARELALATILLVLVAGAAYGSHVVNGGFLMDDWSNAAKTEYLASCCGPGVTRAGPTGYLNVARSMLNDGPAGHHLGLPIVVPPAHFLFGTRPEPHLALAVGLAVLMSAALYLLLRTLGLARLHSGLISTLVLIFPFTDSVRLWPMASYDQLSVVLWLLGLVVALHGLRQRSQAHAVAVHGGALAMFVAGVLIYEPLAGAVVLGAVLYVGRTAWRGALVRWAADIAVTGLTLSYAVAHTLPDGVLSWKDRVDHARLIADDSMTLLSQVLVPFADVDPILVTALVLWIPATALATWLLMPRGDAFRGELERWLVVAGIALVTIGGGYLLMVRASYGTPLAAGIENRVNMVAAMGWVALIYAAAMLAALLVARRARSSPLRAAAGPVVLALLVGAGYLVELDDSRAAYAASATEQKRVLDAVARFGPYPPGSTIYAFGQPGFTAPGVPVYAWVWDLNPAAKMRLQDPSVQAHPILPETAIRCNFTDMYPQNRFGFGEGQAASYDAAFFVNVERGAMERVRDIADCTAAARRFRPGPLARGRDCTMLGDGPATRLGWTCRD